MKNPFLIDIEDKENYTEDELFDIQNKLRKINLNNYIACLRPPHLKIQLDDMTNRITQGIRQTIIDPQYKPSKNLYKVGQGGENCIVCCTSLLTNRCDRSLSILQSLIDVHFDGYFYLMNGSFPNPTGKEMKYVGVPYSFKIFMMLEAKKLNFNKVIWIDAACYAVNNPQKLFDLMDQCSVVCRTFKPFTFETNYNDTVLPQTLKLLKEYSGRDIVYDNMTNSIVFGLNFKDPKMDQFITEYYQMVDQGLPFLSVFPEEVVFSTILNDDKFKPLLLNQPYEYTKLYIHEAHINTENAKNYGFFFLQRHYC